MHVSCSMSDGERYVIIMLVVSLVLCGEPVTQVRIPTHPCIRGSHDNTHKSPLVFHYLGLGRVNPLTF